MKIHGIPPLALAVLALSSVVPDKPARADAPVTVSGLSNDGETELQTTRARFTSDAVAGIIASGQYEAEKVSDGEAHALATSRGVVLPESAPGDYGRPWFIVKAGIGLPNLISAHVEIFVRDDLTVELGAGTGLLPTVYEGSVRWRPHATCWGCNGKNFFSIGFGLDPGVYLNTGSTEGGVGVMVTATVDLMYIHRFARHFGIMVGSRAGIGAVTEFGQSRDWQRIEPALKLNLLEVGFVF